MREEIICHFLPFFRDAVHLFIHIIQHQPVHAPGLPPGPCGFIGIPLLCSAIRRFPGLQVKVVRVIGRIVRAEDHFPRRFQMFQSALSVRTVPCDLGCPVKDRKIQKAVYDQPVIFFCVQFSPCLDELSLFTEPGLQVVRCQKGCLLCKLISRELISCHAGKAVNKTHVMMVHNDTVVDPITELLICFSYTSL